MCRLLQSGERVLPTSRSPTWSRQRCSNTLSSTIFIKTPRRRANPATGWRAGRQAGCMAKAEKRTTTQRIPREVTQAIDAAEDKQADDILLLDLRTAGGFTDYFLVCSGGNARQRRAIADAVMETVASGGSKPAHVEGYERSEWILIDYFD